MYLDSLDLGLCSDINFIREIPEISDFYLKCVD
jgi:hypothetical protein